MNASKPPLNEWARIVNSHFLRSPYEGKDWEAVRKDLIKEGTALLAQEVNSGILEVLGRINDKAMACATQKGTGYEELAKVYDKAVMKELADLTQ